MKTLIQLITVIILFAQTIAYSQTKTIEKETLQTQTQSSSLAKFVGKYLMEEANFELEIVKENDKMYIVTEFSKDPLVVKNETTLTEPSRGVDLELIANNKDALKYYQNGYETVLKRIVSKNKK
ncbi:MAG: hypothetical protein EVB11_00560 [Winogradskyella sp.]|nr:MAG: hypothetical protein EVB11_00560 [Winogradskyella sp.]